MYKNILVPISYEENRDSAQAIEIAKYLAGESGRITLLHVMENVPNYATTYLAEGYLENSLAGLKTDLAKQASTIPNAKSSVITGHSGASIVDYAKAKDCDLIIVASHRPGVSDYFLGSTATHIVRHATCAVHVIR